MDPTSQEIRRYLEKIKESSHGGRAYVAIAMNKHWVWAMYTPDTQWLVWCRHQFTDWLANRLSDPCEHQSHQQLIEQIFNKGGRP